MRVIRLAMMVVFVLLGLLPALVDGKQIDSGMPRAQHPWGQFKIGSWKRVRTQTETLDEKGRVASASTTETTTKLVDVDDAGYTLRVDVVVEAAGKRFTAQPQLVRRGFNGEGEGQTVTVKKIGESGLNFNGRKVSCDVRQITVDTGDLKRVTTVYYNEALAPYVLKRETTCIDAAGKPGDCNCQVDVVAVDMPCKVQTEIKSGAHVRILNQQNKSTTLTLEVHCVEIPGAVVSHTSKETDETGRVVRRSTLDLLDYGIGNGEDADAQTVRKIYHRVRARRAARTS